MDGHARPMLGWTCMDVCTSMACGQGCRACLHLSYLAPWEWIWVVVVVMDENEGDDGDRKK